MIRKFSLSLIILMLSFSSIALCQKRKGVILVNTSKTTVKVSPNFYKFTVGENLTYSVKLNNINAAQLYFSVEEKGQFYGREGYKLNTKVETVGLIGKTLLDVDDTFITYIDPKTRFPYRSEQDVKEGPNISQNTITFDQDKLKAQLDGSLIKLKSFTHDAPGLMWAIRNLDFSNKQVQKLHGLDTKTGKVFEIGVEYIGKETKTINEKEIETVQLAIRTQDRIGKSSDEMNIRMWISNNSQRYPILITATPPFGEIRAELLDLPESTEQKN